MKKTDKKWMPHAVTAGAFVMFIILGLACASTPDSRTETIIPAPTLEELRQKNSEGNNLIVVTKTELGNVSADSYGTVYLVTDPSLASQIRSFVNGRRYDEAARNAAFSAVMLGNTTMAAFSLGPNVQEILVYIVYTIQRGGSDRTKFYQILTIPNQPGKREQFYTIAITRKYDVVMGYQADFSVNEAASYPVRTYYTGADRNNLYTYKQPGFIRLEGIVITYTKDGFAFDGKGTITRYTSGGSYNITIPAEIEGVPVTAIAEKVFQDKGLASITIPDSVTAIGDFAFARNNLKKVTIPKGVTSIGNGAFAANQLTRVVIGADVNMGDNSFDNGFAAFYNSNGKKAGTYNYATKKWSFTAR